MFGHVPCQCLALYLLLGQDTQKALWKDAKGKEHLILKYGYVS